MLRDIGLPRTLRTNSRIRGVHSDARITVGFEDAAKEPTKLDVILGPSASAPRRSPAPETKTAAATESVPEPLRFPIRYDPLFQPNTKLRVAARSTMSGGSIADSAVALRYEDENHVASVLGVVCNVVSHEQEVSHLNNGDCVRSILLGEELA